jgi:hypothetical protein
MTSVQNVGPDEAGVTQIGADELRSAQIDLHLDGTGLVDADETRGVDTLAGVDGTGCRHV